MDVCVDGLDALHGFDDLSAGIAARAGALDAAAAFPDEDFEVLRARGVLAAPLPRHLGGRGFGTEPEGALGALALLTAIGRGSVATARLFEAHVNALKLICLYGSEAQAAQAAADALQGHLFALWVTEVPPGLGLRQGRLVGGKSICSGAGHVTRAVVTVDAGDADPMLAVVALTPGERALPSAIRLAGVRAAVTGAMDLMGLEASLFGRPGDYLRQPEFSAGAWRTSAVTLGAMEALSACVRGTLVARGRADDPHQRARVGAMRIAETTARLWMERVAPLAEARDRDAGDVACMINLARMAVEAAALEMIPLAQRSLGMPAFIGGSAAERIMRDLAAYLRQPAPDETLAEASAWFMARDLPL